MAVEDYSIAKLVKVVEEEKDWICNLVVEITEIQCEISKRGAEFLEFESKLRRPQKMQRLETGTRKKGKRDRGSPK